ncbi:hypothetical protein [Pontibacter ramchanderi]|uniref:Uncharacterized protein n=1 Tax=Pontibacter ramchanderi TaxID=1179743 RepID=A0A2N3V0J1_9BACT|nr:hypothetical protein [Pontibacter ramchanderi]PKV75149.1 hypothetical protein BD749_0087 [Pontibacter ramchanderi]
MMSLALLWALLFHSTVAYAHDTTASTQSSFDEIVQQDPTHGDKSVTGLQSGELYLAQEGTTNALTYSLQPAATITRTHAVRFISHQAMPPYAARAPGDSFFCQFYYTSSQPQAP